ncbi:hypothetical protein T439DRAFT_31039 [Meredithblackwellia eburnea MCA 4105]
MPRSGISSTKGKHIRHPDVILPKGAACLQCKARKVKCSGEYPVCQSCIKHARFSGRDASQCSCDWTAKRAKSRGPIQRVKRSGAASDDELYGSSNESERSSSMDSCSSSRANSVGPGEVDIESKLQPSTSSVFAPLPALILPFFPDIPFTSSPVSEVLEIPSEDVQQLPVQPHPEQQALEHLLATYLDTDSARSLLDPSTPASLPVPQHHDFTHQFISLPLFEALKTPVVVVKTPLVPTGGASWEQLLLDLQTQAEGQSFTTFTGATPFSRPLLAVNSSSFFDEKNTLSTISSPPPMISHGFVPFWALP